MSDLKSHWEVIYGSKSESDLSWHREHLETSLEMIRIAAGGDKSAKVIDVGGGTSRLIDDFLGENFTNLTLLDISGKALSKVRERIGEKANRVKFIESDILNVRLPAEYFDIWHDRTVFHFLTDSDEQKKYVEAVRHSLKPGGKVIIATFGPDGPQKCSGREVCRYDANGLRAVFGKDFDLVDSTREIHLTPWGAQQEFTYCMCGFYPLADFRRAA